MGMFDYFRPVPALPCPSCGEQLADWQGKDGPCLLMEWNQHEAAPAGQRADPPRDSLEAHRLPEVFCLYTSCACGFAVDATGFADNGVWTEVALGFVSTRDAIPSLDVGEGFRQCSGCTHAWLVRGEVALVQCPNCKRLTELPST